MSSACRVVAPPLRRTPGCQTRSFTSSARAAASVRVFWLCLATHGVDKAGQTDGSCAHLLNCTSDGAEPYASRNALLIRSRIGCSILSDSDDASLGDAAALGKRGRSDLIVAESPQVDKQRVILFRQTVMRAFVTAVTQHIATRAVVHERMHRQIDRTVRKQSADERQSLLFRQTRDGACRANVRRHQAIGMHRRVQTITHGSSSACAPSP